MPEQQGTEQRQPRSRVLTRRALGAVAVCCTILTTLSLLATLSAGGMEIDGDCMDSPGPSSGGGGGGCLLFQSLAPLHFSGILPIADDINNNSTTTNISTPSTDGRPRYQVTMYFFQNAFSFHWPAAPTWDTAAGIIHNVDRGLYPSSPALRLPSDLAAVARRMRLPHADYECLEDHHFGGGGRQIRAATDGEAGEAAAAACANPFLEMWRVLSRPEAQREGGAGGVFHAMVSSILFLFAGLVIVTLPLYEWIMRMGLPGLFAWKEQVEEEERIRLRGNRQPTSARPAGGDGGEAEEEDDEDQDAAGRECTCPPPMRKMGLCLCYRLRTGLAKAGSPAGVRDTARASMLSVAGILYALGAVALFVEARLIKTYVDAVDEEMAAQGGGGMQAGYGAGFFVSSALTLACIAVAVACLAIRARMERQTGRIRLEDYETVPGVEPEDDIDGTDSAADAVASNEGER
ncbi:uncharacterized protein B0I36DRAFT_332457 [Microdochium trichocladiopsis]|uniref:Uncharacterized protein n=1 Tax=Microdochium trichocladiopsis TaxID=1682393 RepID=A0A9P8Y1E7_9PEZI|nr:uncharacterized protein B0I36DRAFT_332457 [Microdochium trichocladiopsis]KAH7025056.1 hypothetical protein B0I36DRAFT_332457 [Microdochium trichocladiopsis]